MEVPSFAADKFPADQGECFKNKITHCSKKSYAYFLDKQYIKINHCDSGPYRSLERFLMNFESRK